MHIFFLVRNETTLEFGELNMYGNNYNLRNYSYNFSQIMGRNCLYWFIPSENKEYHTNQKGEL